MHRKFLTAVLPSAHRAGESKRRAEAPVLWTGSSCLPNFVSQTPPPPTPEPWGAPEGDSVRPGAVRPELQPAGSRCGVTGSSGEARGGGWQGRWGM